MPAYDHPRRQLPVHMPEIGLQPPASRPHVARSVRFQHTDLNERDVEASVPVLA
jgi:hypothetical protein